MKIKRKSTSYEPIGPRFRYTAFPLGHGCYKVTLWVRDDESGRYMLDSHCIIGAGSSGTGLWERLNIHEYAPDCVLKKTIKEAIEDADRLMNEAVDRMMAREA